MPYPQPGFQQQVQQQNGEGSGHQQINLVDQLVPRLSSLQTTEERYPGVLHSDRRLMGREFHLAGPDLRLPSMVNFHGGLAGGVPAPPPLPPVQTTFY
jgi:hypothetical protein